MDAERLAEMGEGSLVAVRHGGEHDGRARRQRGHEIALQGRLEGHVEEHERARQDRGGGRGGLPSGIARGLGREAEDERAIGEAGARELVLVGAVHARELGAGVAHGGGIDPGEP